jgi:glucose-1-phosphate thymidylyltransferase
MLAGVRDILVISTPQDLPRYQALLGDGANWGLAFRYAEQPTPSGLAQAFRIGREFVGRDDVCLILGDNIFYGDGLRAKVREAAEPRGGATIFAYSVRDPERYGVVTFDGEGRVLDLEEKPANPRSRWAVTGLYFYDNSVLDIARDLRPSPRELEITDVNREYLRRGTLQLRLFGRGYAWLDTGTHESLLQAANFIQTIEERQGFKIACLEEIAFTERWIGPAELEAALGRYRNTPYGVCGGEAAAPGAGWRRRQGGKPDGRVRGSPMHLLVTGGCGFIGSNFVRLVQQERPDWRITVLDALTYAGNLANLADLKGEPSLRFVRGDIAVPETVRELWPGPMR